MMNCCVYFLALTLYAFVSKTLSNNVSSNPSTWDFRRFAAWDFKDILGDSCIANSKEVTSDEVNCKIESQVSNMTRVTKTEDIVSTLERYLLANTSSGLPEESSDDTSEGLHELHLLKNAADSGAVCLDGSPPGIYLRNGSGVGKSKWIIFFEGGAWCPDTDTCYQRSSTTLGSSKCFPRFLRLEGLLSNQARYNPDFYDWTSVFVRYCDGASFTGDRANSVKVKNKQLYFRGRRILDAVLDELVRRGIDRASEIILSGRSAGALTAIIHADYIRTHFQRVTNASLRVLSDAGFFVDAPSLNGSTIIKSVFRQLYCLHNASTGLNAACLRAQKRAQKWRCFFPQYSVPFVTSKIFLVNALYDLWQIAYLSNVPCVFNLKTCNSTELSHIMKFREKTLHGLRSAVTSNRTGVFADSCFVHTQTVYDLWTKIRVEHVTMARAFAEWYRGDVLNRFRIDAPYPSNPSCPKHYHIK